jgi:hypothetical protein
MNALAPSEETMWKSESTRNAEKMSVREINEKYIRGENRIVTESNREKLPNFVEALRKPGYMDLRPFYQRRPRWDTERQSKLIESFIINVPVPPIFLYEREFNSYEVMDGQQRVTAIKDFYDNNLELEGLEIWPELNGMRYTELPTQVKAGIDRRSISSIVLLRESAPLDEQAKLLRQLVFERLNTGGVKLEKQEIRNALYQGKLNDLLLKISKTDFFRKAWQLPLYSSEEDSERTEIFENEFFKKMEDLEVVLRFFAFRHYEHYKHGIQGFLDLYMIRSLNFGQEDADLLETLYLRTIELATAIYQDLVFRPYNRKKEAWSDRPEKAFYDAVMVGLSRFWDHRSTLIDKKELVIQKTQQLFTTHRIASDELIWRSGNKKALKDRVGAYIDLLNEVVDH